MKRTRILGMIALVSLGAVGAGCATPTPTENSEWVEGCVERRKVASGFPVPEETLVTECRTIEENKWKAHQKRRQERILYGEGPT